MAKHTIPILGVPSADMNDFKRWSDNMSARFGPLPLDRQIECAKSEVDFQHYFSTKLEREGAGRIIGRWIGMPETAADSSPIRLFSLPASDPVLNTLRARG